MTAARPRNGTALASRSATWHDEDDPGAVGLVAKVLRVDLLVTRALDDLASAAGISLADYLVLGVVRRSPDRRSTPTRICEVLRRTTGGMTLTIDRLEASGWLRRSSDPTDRRRVVVELTPAGLRLATKVNSAIHRWEAQLGLANASRARIEAELDTLLTALEV